MKLAGGGVHFLKISWKRAILAFLHGDPVGVSLHTALTGHGGHPVDCRLERASLRLEGCIPVETKSILPLTAT